MMARKFDNLKILLPNGEEEMTLGTWMGEDGEMCVKLRLPEEWSITQVFRSAPPAADKHGKTVITLDRGIEVV
jgi:hypothetical protein